MEVSEARDDVHDHWSLNDEYDADGDVFDDWTNWLRSPMN